MNGEFNSMRDDAVLYVDDESANRRAFRYAFEQDFSVLTAASGAEALELLGGRDVAVLLTDQRMPEMTGVELCVRARALRPDTFRVIVTAFLDAQVAIDAINRGEINAFVVKPWHNEDLAQIIQTGIERVRIERALREIGIGLLASPHGRFLTTRVAEFTHEIGHPLRAIDGFLGRATASIETLQRQAGEMGTTAGAPWTPLSETNLEKLSAALEDLAAAREALALVKALAQSMLGETHRDVRGDANGCDAAPVIAASVRIARAETERVAAVRVVLDAVPRVAIDAWALSEIVLNLLINAAEAIDAAAVENASITVSLREIDGVVLFTVADTGPGIAHKDLARVFEPSFTTKGEGRGLGLARAHALAREAGGEVCASSEPSQGSAFEVRLPRMTYPPERNAQRTRFQTLQRGPR